MGGFQHQQAASKDVENEKPTTTPRLRPFLYAPHKTNPDGKYPFHSSDAEALEPLQHVSDPNRVIIGAPPPLFLHVYKAGGTNVEQFMKRCFGLKAKHLFRKADTDRLLDSNFEDGRHVLEDADVLVGNNALVDATRTGIYTSEPNHRGRAFTMLRHPVEVATSLYYYLQDATWEPGYRPDLKEIPIEVWGTTIDRDNKVVRRLVNKAHNLPLDDKDLHLAKTLLFKHFVVGLTSKMSESLARFDQYFGFSDGVVNGWRRRSTTVEEMRECKKGLLQGKTTFNKHKHSKLDRDSNEWKVLEEYHKWDAQLYEYAEELFEIQANLFEFRTVY